MASLSVRKVNDEVVAKLRIQAARKGISMEEEVRQILEKAVTPKIVISKDELLDDAKELERRMLQAYKVLNEKRASTINTGDLKKKIKHLSTEAQEKGLTQEVLDEIIHDG